MSTSARIILDFPNRKLSPNSRLSWQAKLKPKEQARAAAYYTTLDQVGEPLTVRGPLQARLTFNPPTRRHYDLDNCYSRLKSAQDGICKALQVDDSQIRRVTLEWGDKVKGGRVIFEIEPLEDK